MIAMQKVYPFITDTKHVFPAGNLATPATLKVIAEPVMQIIFILIIAVFHTVRNNSMKIRPLYNAHSVHQGVIPVFTEPPYHFYVLPAYLP